MTRAVLASVAFALLAWGGLVRAGPPVSLPAFNVDIRETSVSGLSSGAYMAVQLQVAHSSIIKGAGIIAGGPYWCAQGSAYTATTRCSCTLDPAHRMCNVSAASTDVAVLVAATRKFARDGLIDDTANLARQRTFVVAGGKDETVPLAVAGQLRGYLLDMGAAAESVSFATLAGAGHGQPTVDYGGACDVSATPYINDCDYDAAGRLLEWIYGSLNPARRGASQGRFVRFDQRPFTPTHFGFAWFTGLDESGWLYVPDACARGEPCRLHVALHGCRQGQSYSSSIWPGGARYGTPFVEHAGYDAWADTNRLVILYPQAVSVMFANPNGCWDWWGYTGRHYADRGGVQMRAIRAMIDRVASGAVD